MYNAITFTETQTNGIIDFFRSATKKHILEKSNLYIIKDSQNRVINKTSRISIAEHFLSQGYTIEYL